MLAMRISQSLFKNCANIFGNRLLSISTLTMPEELARGRAKNIISKSVYFESSITPGIITLILPSDIAWSCLAIILKATMTNKNNIEAREILSNALLIFLVKEFMSKTCKYRRGGITKR